MNLAQEWIDMLDAKGWLGDNLEIVGPSGTNTVWVFVNGCSPVIIKHGKQVNRAFIDGNFIRICGTGEHTKFGTFWLLANVSGIQCSS